MVVVIVVVRSLCATSTELDAARHKHTQNHHSRGGGVRTVLADEDRGKARRDRDRVFMVDEAREEARNAGARRRKDSPILGVVFGHAITLGDCVA
jgi:hypothetical protein